MAQRMTLSSGEDSVREPSLEDCLDHEALGEPF